MLSPVIHAFRLLGALLRRPPGRHRAGAPALARRAHTARPSRSVAPVFPPRPGPYATDTPLDGCATPLVCPYLTAYEREEKARLRRLRRDTLWCAAYGVDLDTRDIHGLSGAA